MMKKRICSILLTAAVLLTSLSGCGKSVSDNATSVAPSDNVVSTESKEAQTQSAETQQEPISKDNLTLKFFVQQSSYVRTDWNDMLQWQEMEKITGIHIDWECVEGSVVSEKRTLALAGGDYPDVFWGAGFSRSEFQKYADEGIFIPLEDLIEENAPNISAVLNNDPSIRKALTLPDGHIYCLPKISLNPNQRIHGKMWYNQPVMDELGLEIPETVDEFIEFLRTVKEKRPDLIPFATTSLQNYVAMIGATYGIYNRSYSSSDFDYDEEANKVRYIPGTEEYKKTLEIVNTMYTEGLIPQSLDGHSLEKLNVYGSQGQLASFMFNHTVPAGEHADEFVNADAPLKGADGTQLEVLCNPKIQTYPAFMITNTNPDPVATIKWLDYLYSEEGERLFFMGIEGVSYTEDENGELHYVDYITNNPDGLQLDEAISLYSVWPGSNVSCVRQVKYALDHPDGNSKFVAVGELYEAYFPKEMWNGFWYTTEENEEVRSITADLSTYVNQSRDEFITGKRSFDEWDSYLADLQKMRADRYLEIAQAAYERYSEN